MPTTIFSVARMTPTVGERLSRRNQRGCGHTGLKTSCMHFLKYLE